MSGNLRPSRPLPPAAPRVPATPHPSWLHREAELVARARALTASEFWAGLGL